MDDYQSVLKAYKDTRKLIKALREASGGQTRLDGEAQQADHLERLSHEV